jgi:hypothetical protein
MAIDTNKLVQNATTIILASDGGFKDNQTTFGGIISVDNHISSSIQGK